MRKALVLPIFLSLAICSWCQAPAAPPDNQAPPSSETQMGGRRRPGVMGTITAIGADSITIKTRDGQTAQVNLNDKTQFSKDRQPAKLADFKVGDEIFARAQSTGENTWQAEMIGSRSGGFGGGGMREGMGKNFIAGEIKSISGTQLVIARFDGQTQTITVDESTSFQKQGQSITLADLKAGDHVFGRGEMKNDVFVPSVLNLGDPGMGGGRGGRNRGAQGGGQGDAAPQGQGAGAPPTTPNQQ